MRTEGEGQLLRIFVDENDMHEGKRVYEVIVHLARAEGLGGATVLRGMMGFGTNALIHAPSKSAHIPEDMPVVVEIVDKAEKIKKFIPILDRVVKEGLVTIEKVNVIAYRHGRHFI